MEITDVSIKGKENEKRKELKEQGRKKWKI